MPIELVMLSNHLILCYPLLLLFSIFPSTGSFPMSQLFASGGQSIGASASVLPMNIRGWFPLGLTGLISLLSKGLSRVFSRTTIGKHQFFIAQSSLWYNSDILTWLLEKLYLWYASHFSSLHQDIIELLWRELTESTECKFSGIQVMFPLPLLHTFLIAPTNILKEAWNFEIL